MLVLVFVCVLFRLFRSCTYISIPELSSTPSFHRQRTPSRRKHWPMLPPASIHQRIHLGLARTGIILFPHPHVIGEEGQTSLMKYHLDRQRMPSRRKHRPTLPLASIHPQWIHLGPARTGIILFPHPHIIGEEGQTFYFQKGFCLMVLLHQIGVEVHVLQCKPQHHLFQIENEEDDLAAGSYY